MKNLLILISCLPLFLSSCSKSDENKCIYTNSLLTASAAEIAYLQNYMTANSLTATQHSSGIFYTIENPGTGTTANVCSNVTVTYTGNLLSNGFLFDSNTTAAGISFTLGQLIVGWQKGLPLIKSGGRIILYIPPSLGYGSSARNDSNGNVIIPANSYLKFTINLMFVQ